MTYKTVFECDWCGKQVNTTEKLTQGWVDRPTHFTSEHFCSAECLVAKVNDDNSVD